MGPLRILLVDDDADHAQRLSAAFQPVLGSTVMVRDAYQALALHSEEPFDVVVLDVALPGASGIDLVERLVPAVPAVVVTWMVSPAITARVLEAGAHSVLSKAASITDLVAAVQAAARSQGQAVLVTAWLPDR